MIGNAHISFARFAHMASVAPALSFPARHQPNEAIYLTINNKVPGLGLKLDRSKLDLQYKARYDNLQARAPPEPGNIIGNN